MTLIAQWRSRRIAAEIRRRAADFAREAAPPERESIQLKALNEQWARLTASTPYWRDLRRAHGLPGHFGSLREFCQRVPPTRREDLQEHVARMTVEDSPPDLWRMTGGSTSEPVKVPAWRSELAHLAPNLWVGRGWYGISPSSRLFLLWGHSHLLGGGLAGRLRGLRRRLDDRLLGYHRFSAYDLRVCALRDAAEAMLAFRPEYVLGYSVALDLFARANEDRATELRGLGVSMLVGTAEAFPSDDSQRLLNELFHAPVAMEYGSVETGLVAHTHPQGDYRVFWRDQLVEGERTEGGWHLVRVTSLHARCLPLVRYEIGDEVELEAEAPSHAVGVDRLRRVVGRCNDYVPMADGALIHSEAFSHAIRPCAEVRAFQVLHGEHGVRIRYTADAELSAASAAGVRERLGKIHPDLADARLLRAEVLPHTVAGKTRMVIRD